MQLAQLNIAFAKYDMDSPELKEFVDNLDYINGIAEASSGFVWRLKDDSGNATDIRMDQDPKMLVNLSVWNDADALKNFLFKTDHKLFLARRSEWFEVTDEATYVLWWVEDGHRPDLNEAMDKLTLLREQGDSPEAFSFKRIFSS